MDFGVRVNERAPIFKYSLVARFRVQRARTERIATRSAQSMLIISKSANRVYCTVVLYISLQYSMLEYLLIYCTYI